MFTELIFHLKWISMYCSIGCYCIRINSFVSLLHFTCSHYDIIPSNAFTMRYFATIEFSGENPLAHGRECRAAFLQFIVFMNRKTIECLFVDGIFICLEFNILFAIVDNVAPVLLQSLHRFRISFPLLGWCSFCNNTMSITVEMSTKHFVFASKANAFDWYISHNDIILCEQSEH